MSALEQAIESGELAWPGLQVSQEQLAAHLKQLLADDADLDSALDELKVDELYLACACALGEDRAIAAFEEHFLPQVAGYIARVTRDRGEVEELRQRLREKLFVTASAAERPKICEYGGRGPLGAWLRVVALRMALDLKRRGQPLGGTEIDENLRTPALDPELAYLKAHYSEEFREAFEATLAELATDERNLLKLHYLDGLNIDELGVAYHVHRSTAARRVAQARTRILDETRRRLSERSGLKGQELDSLLGLVRSQLDVSISRFLKEE